MSGVWIDIALVGVLVLVNAVFSGTEMALVSLREGQLKALERDGGAKEQRLVRLARDPNRFLATIQIGITLAGFLASATAAVSLAEPLVPSLSRLGSAAEPVAVAGVTLILTFLTLVLGELAPKRLAMQMALPWALVMAGPIDVLSTLSRPVIVLLGAATNVVVRVFGGRLVVEPEDISSEELRDLVKSHAQLDQGQREIISGALAIRTRILREVLVPRGRVIALDAGMSITEARTTLAAAGHSRAPVTRHHELDQVMGVVHWAALIHGGSQPVSTVAAPAIWLPDTLAASEAIQRFKAERQHLAIVVDEYGSVDGIVTLEDLLEEIVGEIYDETDSDVLAAQRGEDGSLTLPGSFPIHDLADIGVLLEVQAAGNFTTVAGLVLSLLGRVPKAPGDVVTVDGWELEVGAVERRAVTQVIVRPPATASDGVDAHAGPGLP